MAGWEVPLGIVLTVIGGFALAIQAGVNASLGANITKPVAAIVSFGMGTAVSCVYLLVDATAVSKQLPSVADVQGAPWWAWIGGVLGAYYVIINIIFAIKLGAGTAVAVFVCSQLAMSIVLDLTGLVGFQKRAFSWPRITGVVLMIMGVILVTQFPGQVIHPKPQDPEAQQQQQQPQQQQPPAKQPKHLQDGLQAASAASLLPTATNLSPGGDSSSSSSASSGLGRSSGSAGSLELAHGGSSTTAGGGSGRGLRGMAAVGVGGPAHMQFLHQRHHHAQQQQQQLQRHRADIEVQVLDH